MASCSHGRAAEGGDTRILARRRERRTSRIPHTIGRQGRPTRGWPPCTSIRNGRRPHSSKPGRTSRCVGGAGSRTPIGGDQGDRGRAPRTSSSERSTPYSPAASAAVCVRIPAAIRDCGLHRATSQAAAQLGRLAPRPGCGLDSKRRHSLVLASSGNPPLMPPALLVRARGFPLYRASNQLVREQILRNRINRFRPRRASQRGVEARSFRIVDRLASE